MSTISLSITPGKDNRYFDFRVQRNAFTNEDGTPVRTEVLYESLRNALLGAEIGLEMIMIRVGKYPAYRTMPHFALHVPALKRIYYDPLQAFRSSVNEINRRGSLRLWSFRSEADFWEVKPKSIKEDSDILSEDNLPEEILDKPTISAAPLLDQLSNTPVELDSGLDEIVIGDSQYPGDEPATTTVATDSLLDAIGVTTDAGPETAVEEHTMGMDNITADPFSTPQGTIQVDIDEQSDGQADTLAK